MPTVNYQVAASNDDADEYGDATFNLTGTSVFVVENTNTASSLYRCAGVRFDGVAVPQGATPDLLSEEQWRMLGVEPLPDMRIGGVGAKIAENDGAIRGYNRHNL
jgi:hypothetical protein